jgi:transposase
MALPSPLSRGQAFEATGDYDRHLRATFDAQSIAYARVNPQQARDFARAMGRRAKNDALDAHMLAAMAQALEPARAAPRDARREELAALHKRRDQLVDIRAAEKVRIKEAEDLGSSLASHLAWLDAEIARFERLIEDLIAGDAALAEDTRLLRSVPGIGPVGATTLQSL